MRWNSQEIHQEATDTLPGLAKLSNVVRSLQSPDFQGVTFHEVLAKSALNHVPSTSSMPFSWTINPYRGCSHACVYCFARPTHTYLDLDHGKDFDNQVIVKINIAEVLRKELAKPSWSQDRVALGTNTDPYQRAEGKYALMPDMLRALAHSGTPFSILTKGSLLRRDLPLLTELRGMVPISLAMSIAIFDPELQESIEPGTPSFKARLSTVQAASEAGFNVSVFMMPILPHLTDSVEHLSFALDLIRKSGASNVMYTALHLRGLVKPWFMNWLGQTHPELVKSYLELYPGNSAYAPKEYRQWLAARMKPLIAKAGLTRDSSRSKTTAGVATQQRSTPLDGFPEPNTNLFLPTLF